MKQRKNYSRLKKAILAILIIMVAFWAYVEIANRNSKNMTGRQKFLKTVYPAWIWWLNVKSKNAKVLSNKEITPPVSFYSLKDTLNNGTVFDFEQLRGKKVILVNTSSDSGYTGHYDDLQNLS